MATNKTYIVLLWQPTKHIWSLKTAWRYYGNEGDH